MSTEEGPLAEFGARKDTLAGILADLATLFMQMGRPTRATDLNQARERLLEERFRILVMGDMKRGKSTLINAMLGADVLPSWPGTSCTAIPISVAFSEERRAVCHRRPPDAPMHFDLAANKQAFWDAVTVPQGAGLAAAEEASSDEQSHPYVRAEVFWPLALCRDGVEIQDSPGLNERALEGAQRGEAAWDQAGRADAVVLVWSCGQVCTESEFRHAQSLLGHEINRRSVFVAFNRFDDCRGKAAEDRVRADARRALASLGIAESQSAFVVASEALDARLSANADALAASGIPALEQSLARFLLNDRLAAKLATPLDVGERAVDEALLDVQVREESEVARLLDGAEEAMEQARAAERRSGDISAVISIRARRSLKAIRSRAQEEVHALGEALVEGIPAEVQSVEVTGGQAVLDGKAARERIVTHVQQWITQQAADWERTQLGPLVSELIEELRDAFSGETSELATLLTENASRLERLQAEGRSDGPSNEAAGNQGLQRAERIKAMARHLQSSLDGTLLNLESGSSVGLAAVIGGALASWLAVVLSLPFFPVVIVGVALATVFGTASAANRLKARVSAAVIAQLQEHLPEFERRVERAVRHKVAAVIEALETDTVQAGREITAIKDAIAAELALRRSRSQAMRDECSAWRSRLQSHAVEISSLRREIEPPDAADAETHQDHGQAQATEVPTGTDPRTLVEIKRSLDVVTLDRLAKCRDYFVAQRRWEPRMELILARLWTWFGTQSDVRAYKQVPAYRAVTAIAVAEGQSDPPQPAEVRRRWVDSAYRAMLMELHVLITDSDGTLDFTDDQPGQFDNGGIRYCRAYERAYDRLMTSGGRPGTIAGWDGSSPPRIDP